MTSLEFFLQMQISFPYNYVFSDFIQRIENFLKGLYAEKMPVILFFAWGTLIIK